MTVEIPIFMVTSSNCFIWESQIKKFVSVHNKWRWKIGDVFDQAGKSCLKYPFENTFSPA